MKMSVIFGILHMTFGIIIKGMNSVYFKRYLVLLTEVLAGIIILWGLFGWMNILIVAKFFKQVDIDDLTTEPLSDYDKFRLEKLEDPTFNGKEYLAEIANRKLPSIVSIMITSVFSPGTCPKEQEDLTSPIGGSICDLYAINMVLLLFVLICVPAMLCTMPCLTLF